MKFGFPLIYKLKLISLVLLMPIMAFSQDIENRIAEIKSEIERAESEMSIDITLKGSLIVRNAPNSFANQIALLEDGERIKVVGFEERYFHILYEDDNEGFVPLILLQRVTSNEDIFDIVNKVEEMHAEIDNLNNKVRQADIEARQREREEARIRKDEEEQRLLRLHEEIRSEVAYINVFTGNIRKDPSTESQILHRLPQGEMVYIQNKQGQWYQVKIPNIGGLPITSEDAVFASYDIGWIHHSILSKEFVQKLTIPNRRRILYVNNNPGITEQYKQAILNGAIRIGMTKEMVEASLGSPRDINRTVTANKVREQWVYGSVRNRRYIYFTNGVLDAFQD